MKLQSIALAAALCLGGLTGAAQAEVFHICSARETKDGFVALRAAPKKDAPVVAKMVPGQMIVIDVKDYKAVSKGGWISVSWFPGEVMPDKGEDGYDKIRRGWMSKELVDDCG